MQLENQLQQWVVAESKEISITVDDARSQHKSVTIFPVICAWCNKLRDDSGNWHQSETDPCAHTDRKYSHGICPECVTIFRETIAVPKLVQPKK